MKERVAEARWFVNRTVQRVWPADRAVFLRQREREGMLFQSELFIVFAH